MRNGRGKHSAATVGRHAGAHVHSASIEPRRSPRSWKPAGKGMRFGVATVCTFVLATVCVTLVASAVAVAQSRATYDKTQVVYAKLDASGSQEGVYAVNSFVAAAAGTVSDKGKYDEITNLSDNQQLSDADGTVEFEMSADAIFRYQGDLAADTELPWTVQVFYKLDGKLVSAKDLSGKSGQLEMVLNIAPASGAQGAMRGYVDNYLLQVTGTFDGDDVTIQSAADATKAQAGDNVQLTYMVFPGKSACYTVTAQVNDFNFDGWQIVGVPLSIALSISDDDLSGVSDSTGELTNAIAKVNEGAGSISSAIDGSLIPGLTQLSGGSDAYNAGLNNQSSSLNQQAQAIDVSESKSAMEQALAQYMGGYVGKYTEVYTGILVQQFTQAYTSEFVTAYTPAYVQAYTPLYAQKYAELVMGGTDPQQAVTQASVWAASQVAMQTIASQASAAALSQVDVSSIAASAAQQAKQATDTDEDVGTLQQQFKAALETFVTAQATKSGLESASTALGGAAQSYSPLDFGIKSAVDPGSSMSVYALSKSASQLSSGTQMLADETADLDKQIIKGLKEGLEEYLNPNYKTVDFASASNKNTSAVQFVLKTAAL